MRKILIAVGSHSEAIRIAPLVHRLRTVSSMQTIVCIAAPHRHMLQQVLSIFGIVSDDEFDSTPVAPRRGIDSAIEKYRPDCVLVHGDDSGTIASTYLQFPQGDTDSGLQMYELRHLENGQTNGTAIDVVAKYHFVPTEDFRDSLLDKGVAPERIYLTDYMLVDALLMVVERIRHDDRLQATLTSAFPFLDARKQLVLVTGHQHGNRDGRLADLCRALKRLATRPDVQVVYRLHRDPERNETVTTMLGGQPNVVLLPLQDYLHFAFLMQAAHFIVTDRGGTLMEALSLSKPVVVLRDVNERPDAVDPGTVKLVGTDPGRILRECTRFLDDPSYYRAFSTHRNPYGDGQTSQRIVETLLR